MLFKSLAAFISHMTYRSKIIHKSYAILYLIVFETYDTKLILIYRVSNEYIGCNMQKMPFSCYYKGF